jgi:hypothetical protein
MKQGKELTSSDEIGKKGPLVSSMFLELKNDADFMLVVQRWAELSDGLRQAIVRLVR